MLFRSIGWTMGTVVSALGMFLSVHLDLPTGATIVCTFGGVLLVMFLIHLIMHKPGYDTTRPSVLRGHPSTAEAPKA